MNMPRRTWRSKEDQKMEIIELDKGWGIKFRFELKDSFREVFPTAKWNPVSRQWEMGVRAKKNFEAWASEVQTAEAALVELEKEKEAAEWSESEIEKIKASIAQVIAETSKSKAALPKQEALMAVRTELLERLKELEPQLSKERARVASAKKSAQQSEARIRQKMEGIVDFAAIEAAFRKMQWAHRGVGSTHRRAFEEAQAVINEQIENLAEAGWGNVGLNWASNANFNRPERDGLNRMPAGAMDEWFEFVGDEEDVEEA
jgi:DNA repair exonuclease SbcCD ATPase subunit